MTFKQPFLQKSPKSHCTQKVPRCTCPSSYWRFPAGKYKNECWSKVPVGYFKKAFDHRNTWFTSPNALLIQSRFWEGVHWGYLFWYMDRSKFEKNQEALTLLLVDPNPQIRKWAEARCRMQDNSRSLSQVQIEDAK